MKKNEVIEKFCLLSDLVAKEEFGHMVAADCFCGTSTLWDDSFSFDPDILEFIETAINEKHERDRK